MTKYGNYKNPMFGLRVPTPLMDKLKYIAASNGRSANKEIEQIIIAYVAEYERKHGLITQGE